MNAMQMVARMQRRAAIAARYAEEARDQHAPIDEVLDWQDASAHLSRGARSACDELRRMDQILDGILRDARGAT